MVDSIRLSLGTAIVLGLEHGPELNHFSTLFIMTDSEKGCSANCAFCPQAAESIGESEKLSRIGWPKYEIREFEDAIRGKLNEFQRVCIQSLNYSGVIDDCLEILDVIKGREIPVSICIHPISKVDMKRLRNRGIDRIGIALDACTEEIFDRIKGKAQGSMYNWDRHLEALKDATDIWGEENVTTHLIVGLGESEEDAAEFLLRMKEMGIRVGLFAFTNIKGTQLENMNQPELAAYRRIQILHSLLLRGKVSRDNVRIVEEKIQIDLPSNKLRDWLLNGNAFRVSGCPGCNRPYYNERPSGPMYNYPRPLKRKEVIEALEQSGMVN